MDLETILQFVGAGAASVFGWMIGRRQKNAETDNQVLKNLELSIDVYRQIIDDLKEELIELNEKVDSLQKKVDDLLKENHQLKNMMRHYNKKTEKKPRNNAAPTDKPL
jgi:peptidoglycan hydrolase CwlO-like protein